MYLYVVIHPYISCMTTILKPFFLSVNTFFEILLKSFLPWKFFVPECMMQMNRNRTFQCLCIPFFQKIHDHNMKCGIAINPDTPIAAVESYLQDADMILVMSVQPGFGGQKLIPATLDKITALHRLRQENGWKYLIEVDGGVNADTLESVARTGVDIAVAGTAVFGGDIESNLKKLRGVIADAS